MPKAVNKALSEEATQELEARIPAQASLATRMAYEKAKAAGRTVVLSKGGFIVAERADGTEQIVCASKPRRSVKAGVCFKIGSGASASAGS
ncbi:MULTISPECIES: hypothetical protein [Pseudomonas]|uniref:Uncharacterized protein n=8 Tax=Pseudomonas syringae group TaxID=136849 RepID=A0A0P9WCC5_PSESS|nr:MULTISPECIES: hypothetical protein [Pseudomonas]KPW27898.1 Uncharacterized protein ALO51_01223 [Pseudomonas amygdali]ARD11311.1 hypothetical protein PSA3335_09660 [Pseudomonas savastanoi pv. savastanoi NCPPB 3335]EGH06053.1 hypothetical protein PSYAE_29665 [Pseudomonas amygdali pv. aesculi str. 0893_23]KAA3547504.1 hypothetical protein DXU85_04950 [Pseudomonas savastanoi]KPB18919.1 hypothetical protein AC519_1845 [Pseudomonas savastanoi]